MDSAPAYRVLNHPKMEFVNQQRTPISNLGQCATDQGEMAWVIHPLSVAHSQDGRLLKGRSRWPVKVFTLKVCRCAAEQEKLSIAYNARWRR
jgi:hypothetical protein